MRKEAKLLADVVKWKEEARQAELKQITLEARMDAVVTTLQGQLARHLDNQNAVDTYKFCRSA